MSDITIPGYSSLAANRFYARTLPGGEECDLVFLGRETIVSPEDIKKLAIKRAERTLTTTLFDDSTNYQTELRRIPEKILGNIAKNDKDFSGYFDEVSTDRTNAPYAGRWVIIGSATVDYSKLSKFSGSPGNVQDGFYFGLIESSPDGFSASVKLDDGKDFPSLSAAKYLLKQGIRKSHVFQVSSNEVSPERVLRYLRLAKRTLSTRTLVSMLEDRSLPEIELAVCSLIQGYASFVVNRDSLEMQKIIERVKDREEFARRANFN